MFKLKYRVNSSVEEVSFNDFRDLVYFVAQNRIADDAVESITLFGEEMSLFGLADKVMNSIDEQKAAEAAAEAAELEAEAAEAAAAETVGVPEGATEVTEEEPAPMTRAEEILAWFDEIYEA